MTPKGYRCTCCGEWHDGLPLDLAFDEPLYVAELDATERAAQVEGAGDFRVLREGEATHYFIRGVVELPIRGGEETFCYGAWTTLSAESFEKAIAAHREGREAGPFFGWFSNRIPGYPDTLGLKAQVRVRETFRASITLEATDHPLSLEQREGLDWEQVQRIVERALHPGASSSAVH